jgi:hypothetical protein
VDRGKLESAALLLTVAGVLLIMPPLAQLFQWQRRFFGVPIEVIYLFLVWAGMVVGARALARRMPHETPPPADDNGSG